MTTFQNPSNRSQRQPQPARPHLISSTTLEQLRSDAVTRIQSHLRQDQQLQPHHQPTRFQDDLETLQQTIETRTVEVARQPDASTVTTSQPLPAIANEPLHVTNENPWSPGTEIDNRYQLIQAIGAGAWGTIWKARQKGIDRFVAIKILKERDEPGMLKARSRFEREAKLASRVRHPSAVRVLDYGHLQNQPYLVMEWLEGISLQRFLNDCGPLPPELVLDIAIGVCGALHAAHQEDVIHRDLKPSNIMLVETSAGLTPVVVDFGLARTFTPDEPTVTHANMIVGTPAYMSPESIRGRPLTPASDIYSLGTTFVTILFGDNPFRGETGSVTMTNHLLGPPFSVDSLKLVGCSDDFARTLMAMISMNPEDRPTARALEERFKQQLDDFILNPPTYGDLTSHERVFSDLTDPSNPQRTPPDSTYEWVDPVTQTAELSSVATASFTQAPPPFSPAPTTTLPPSKAEANQNPSETNIQEMPEGRAQALSGSAAPSTPSEQAENSAQTSDVSVIAHSDVGSDASLTTLDQDDAINAPPVSIQRVQPSSPRRRKPQRSLVPIVFTALFLVSGGLLFLQHQKDGERAQSVAPVSAFPLDIDPPRAKHDDAVEATSFESTGHLADHQFPALEGAGLSTQNAQPAHPIATKDIPRPKTPEMAEDLPPTAHVDKSKPPVQDAAPRNQEASVRTASTPKPEAKAAKPAPISADLPASLVLTVSPPGQVFVNGTSHGLRSSLILNDLKRGRYTIRVERDGENTERRVRLESGQRRVEAF